MRAVRSLLNRAGLHRGCKGNEQLIWIECGGNLVHDIGHLLRLDAQQDDVCTACGFEIVGCYRDAEALAERLCAFFVGYRGHQV